MAAMAAAIFGSMLTLNENPVPENPVPVRRTAPQNAAD
jgi:hypothetical protein